MKLSSMMLATAALAFTATSTAWAQTQSTPAPSQPKNAKDPNEIVCQKIEVPGSRLVSKRVCMTRAQWADQQRQDRMDTERAQMQRPCAQGSGC
jgi:invasion protein IalB